MKLYLDMCCLKRPFDDLTDARIGVEAAAFEAVLQLCREGRHVLVGSDVLRFENERNPNARRREFARSLLELAAETVPHSAAVEKQSEIWLNAGVGLLDALHLASAELAGADAFATCDDVLLQRAGRVSTNLRVLSLIDLFKELVP